MSEFVGKVEAAHESLREAILGRRFQPGQHLTEAQLSHELQVSRPTLRPILIRLEEDQFLTLVANRGARLRQCQPREVVEAYEAREILEAFAAALAAKRATPSEVDAIATRAQAMADAHRVADTDAFFNNSEHFHNAIVAAARQPMVASFYRATQYPIAMYGFRRSEDANVRARTIVEHDAILACIRSGDASGAEGVMRHHIAARRPREWFGLENDRQPAVEQPARDNNLDSGAGWQTNDDAAPSLQVPYGGRLRSKHLEACQKLRERILSGHFRPGERLTESYLSVTLEVSSPTLRAVLAQLERENFVTCDPYQGARVRTFNETDLTDLWQARMVIEARCCGLAAERATELEVTRLEHLVSSMQVAHNYADRHAYATLSTDFHHALIGAAHQRVLPGFLSSLRYPPIVFNARRGGEAAVRATSLAEHQAILACIRIKDPVGAEEVMRKHFDSAEPGIAQDLEERTPMRL